MKIARHATRALLTVSAGIAIYATHAGGADEPRRAAVATPAVAASQPAARPALVRIDNFHFEPKELEVAAGTTVTWHNADDVPHTATSKDDPSAFDSGALDTDDKFSFTFAKPGRYAYFCKVHPHMTGVVIVK